MTFPGMFSSSPSRARGYLSHETVSSSPDLPSIREMLLQKPKRPLLKGGSKSAPIPDNATTTSMSAGRFWTSPKGNDAVKSGSGAGIAVSGTLEDIDASVSDTETALKNTLNARKPWQRENAAPQHIETQTEKPTCSNSPAKDQPWRKYKSPVKGTNGGAIEPSAPVLKGASVWEPTPGDTAENFDRSRFFQSPDSMKPKKVKAAREDANESLHLEPAMNRRMDWTPPAQRIQIILDSDDPVDSKDPHCSPGHDEPTKSFETILASFKCNGTAIQEAIPTIADEDSAFLKKRKLLELVPTKAANVLELGKSERLAVKQKAPKKKPRTITALATAAYRPLTQPEHISVHNEESGSATKPAGLLQGKCKTRKRPPKASKKDIPPPRPALLSPRAALDQVAHQDFVFGTSSQLAREQSPTLLRDLQMAMRESNRLDDVELTTPVNSDAIEPPERGQALWDAGARDADGDLFDFEVRNLAEGSPRLPEPAAAADPFGYVPGDDDAITLPELPAVNKLRDDDSFLNLSDVIPAPGRHRPIEVIDDDSPFPGSQLSAGTAGRRNISPSPVEKRHGSLQRADGEGGNQARKVSDRALISHETRPRPSLELCSDAELAKKVAQYGFKPVKRRTAMLALLEKCWQESAPMGHGSTRCASTVATGKGTSASEPPKASAVATVKEKRPRGRPRKLSTGEGATQEPPLPAQSSEPLKRPRGRPRKVSVASPPRVSTVAEAKTSSTERRRAPATPERKSRVPRAVIEIPDSELDGAADLSESPCASPNPTFSPHQPVDFSLSVEEDTQLSPSTSPTDQQAALFSHITKAVATAPRTTDPAHPSWHEKILLYDPIVLEDLTSWLNCGQLTRVGYDGEASSGEVKKWCESKSICCLWRVNLRGKERKRF